MHGCATSTFPSSINVARLVFRFSFWCFDVLKLFACGSQRVFHLKKRGRKKARILSRVRMLKAPLGDAEWGMENRINWTLLTFLLCFDFWLFFFFRSTRTDLDGLCDTNQWVLGAVNMNQTAAIAKWWHQCVLTHPPMWPCDHISHHASSACSFWSLYKKQKNKLIQSGQIRSDDEILKFSWGDGGGGGLGKIISCSNSRSLLPHIDKTCLMCWLKMWPTSATTHPLSASLPLLIF